LSVLKSQTRETMRFAGHDFKKTRPRGDFYETPELAVEKLLEKEPFTGEVWDPASGGGVISAESSTSTDSM
jgi:hypothetical protein